jgi:hypothetical protein
MVPTGSIQQTVAPGAQGQFGLSPFAQATSLAAMIASAGGNKELTEAIKGGVIPPAKAEGGAVWMADGGDVEDVMPAGAEYHDGQGNYYDEHGYLVG